MKNKSNTVTDSQLSNLNSQNEGLREKIKHLENQISNTPKFVHAALAEQIVDARDDVEYYRRRLEEAQFLQNKILIRNNLPEVDIKIVIPEKRRDES